MGEGTVEPRSAGGHRADGLAQFLQRPLLQENAGDALPQQAPRFGVAHPGGHHQHAAFETDLARGWQELGGALAAQVVIQQDEIEGVLREQFERLPDAGAVLDFEKRFLRENA